LCKVTSAPSRAGRVFVRSDSGGNRGPQDSAGRSESVFPCYMYGGNVLPCFGLVSCTFPRKQPMANPLRGSWHFPRRNATEAIPAYNKPEGAVLARLAAPFQFVIRRNRFRGKKVCQGRPFQFVISPFGRGGLIARPFRRGGLIARPGPRPRPEDSDRSLLRKEAPAQKSTVGYFSGNPPISGPKSWPAGDGVLANRSLHQRRWRAMGGK